MPTRPSPDQWREARAARWPAPTCRCAAALEAMQETWSPIVRPMSSIKPRRRSAIGECSLSRLLGEIVFGASYQPERLILHGSAQVVERISQAIVVQRQRQLAVNRNRDGS